LGNLLGSYPDLCIGYFLHKASNPLDMFGNSQ
jgi:hypothetical protein